VVAQSAHKPYVLPVGTVYLESAPLAARRARQGPRCWRNRRRASRSCSTPPRQGTRLVVGHVGLSRPPARCVIADILRTIADGEQDDIALEGTDVDYGSMTRGR